MPKAKTPDRSPPIKKKGRTKKTKPSTTKKKRKPQARCTKCDRTKRWCKCPGKGGRPPKLDGVTVQKLVEIFRIDGTIAQACSQAGISSSTYHVWYNEKKEFVDINGQKRIFTEEIDKAQAYAGIVAQKTVLRNIQNGDGKLAMEYLRRRDERFKDKQENTINLGNIVNENDLIDD